MQEWVDEGCGRNESYTSFDCILVPLSTCDPRQHVTKENSLRVYPWVSAPAPVRWDKTECPEPWATRLRDHYAAHGVQVSPEYLKYWWRAQVRWTVWFGSGCRNRAAIICQGTTHTGQH